MKIEEHPFIESVSTGRRAEVVNEVEILDLNSGEIIFRDSSYPDALYIVLEGSVVFTKPKRDGSVQEISSCSEGSFFGEVGVFTGELRALEARAKTACIVGRVPEKTVKKIIEDAEPVKRILESVIHHLKSTTSHYVDEVMRTEKKALVGTMVSSILHDFKNPFSIISLGAHIISQRYGDDPKTTQICSNIESQIRRMVEMANDLAAFGRGEEQIDAETVSLEKLFDYFKDLNSPFFNDESVNVEMHPNGIELEGDSGKLIRVLQNLITNAIEAIHQTTRKGHIVVIAKEAGEIVDITVQDNGPGIPQEIQSKFFEPFVTFGKADGTGLGSAIVKSIIEAHGGSVDFSSSSGGTLFTMRIPKHQPTRPEEEESSH